MWNVFICSFSLEIFGGIMVDWNTRTRMFHITIVVIVKVKKLVNKYSAVILVANAKKLMNIKKEREKIYVISLMMKLRYKEEARAVNA